MPTLLTAILALLGIGAAAGGGGSSTSSEPSAGTPEPTPTATPRSASRDEITPPKAVEEDPPEIAADDAPIKVTSPPSDPPSSPELPDSAYDLDWAGLSAQEQYMLELVNRARMDPEAEVARTGEVVDSGVSTAPKQALAPDPILSRAADNHSEDMLDRGFFAHTNPDGENPTARAEAEGWDSRGVWENIAARWTSANSVSDKQGWIDKSHEGLWESNGHQKGMLQDGHTVTGISVDWGPWTYPDNPVPTAMVVTEKFSNDGQTYLTGVVIDDKDNDDFYDIGEGQGGVKITATKGDDTYATSTWDAGGYSLALDAGTYNVRFEGGDLETAFETAVTIGTKNVKLDVNEDDLSAPMMATLSDVPDEEEDDPIAALFLSAEASSEVIEREAMMADRHAEDDVEDLLEMI